MTTLMNWSRCRGDWNNLGPNVAEKLTNIAEKLKSAHPLFPGFFWGDRTANLTASACHFLPRHVGRVASAGFLQSYTNCKERKGKNLSNCCTSELNFSLIFWTNLMKPGEYQLLSKLLQISTFQLFDQRKSKNIPRYSISIVLPIYRHLYILNHMTWSTFLSSCVLNSKITILFHKKET